MIKEQEEAQELRAMPTAEAEEEYNHLTHARDDSHLQTDPIVMGGMAPKVDLDLLRQQQEEINRLRDLLDEREESQMFEV